MKKQDLWFLEEETQTAGEQELALLLENVKVPGTPERKEFVEGTIVQKTKEGFFVNIGTKYDAFLPKEEAGDAQVGENALFWVLSPDNVESHATVSYEKAKGWMALSELKEQGDPIEARIFCLAKSRYSGRVSGVRVVFDRGIYKGIRGFVPTREIRHRGRLEDLVDREMLFSIVDVNPLGGGEFGTLVMSSKRADERLGQEAFDQLAQGDIVKGRVRNHAKLGSDGMIGIFVDLDCGLTGLMYENNVVCLPGKSLAETVPVGMERDFEIVRLDRKQRKLWLSVRNLDREQFLSALAPGRKMVGQVIREYSYGCFVQLGADYNGLIHVTEMRRFAKSDESPVAVGHKVEVEIVSVAENGHRIALKLISTNV